MIYLVDELYHFGVSIDDGAPIGSGRYPKGSGENPYQRAKDFTSRLNNLKIQYPNATEKDLANYMEMSVKELRARKSIATNEIKIAQAYKIRKMRDSEQMSFRAIAEEMGYKNESIVRNIYNNFDEAKAKEARTTAETIKKAVDEHRIIMLGEGVERELGISKEKLEQAIVLLKDQGYIQRGRSVPQVANPTQMTHLLLITSPDVTAQETYDNSKIHSLNEYHSDDNGVTFNKTVYPASMDSKRLMINYAEDGGIHKDGVIEIRRGVADLDLGKSSYAQARILVDNKLYLKGMCMYADDLPDGVDIRFNTNKSKGAPIEKVLKPIKEDDPTNPFGSNIKANGQSYYTDPKTGEKKLSLINKTREEGEWGEWSKTLPSQMLGKQDITLINRQLDLSIANKKNDYETIKELTNPVIKKYMLNKFASECDATAVNLDAASLPRQQYQVILPLTKIKDNEIYAPNYKNGETVALIRYPHGGLFEIPILTVNNGNSDGKSKLGQAKDAVGISSAVAERLSGADFDGDTVMVIPCNRTNKGTISKVQINNQKQLDGLKNFDPKTQYAYTPGMKVMTKKQTQREMGIVTNLITDMTLQGASEEDLTKAVRHSMVVIDAEKHKLNYKQSEKDNDIARLKKDYQLHYDKFTGKEATGASTILSLAKNPIRVHKTQGSPHVDKETGKLIYTEAPGYLKKNKDGTTSIAYNTVERHKMSVVDDAFDLVKDTNNIKEVAYANYANAMKGMANQARKEALSLGSKTYSPSAAKAYAKEVSSLNSKINESAKNAPRERMAQVIARSMVDAVDTSSMTKEQKGKLSQRCLVQARIQVGAHRVPLEVTDNEWDAIQAGAVSSNTLNMIIKYAGADTIAARATPKATHALSNTDQRRIQALYASGNYTVADIAEEMGISTTTVWKYLS